MDDLVDFVPVRGGGIADGGCIDDLPAVILDSTTGAEEKENARLLFRPK
jgi:hypothetical protein